LDDRFVKLGRFTNGSEIWLCKRLSDNIISFSFELSHLWLVSDVVTGKEVFRQLDVENPYVLSDLLVSDDTKLGHVDSTAHLNLVLAPLSEGMPNEVISCLTDDIANCVGVTTEVPLYCFIAKKLNIEVAIASCSLSIIPIHI
jgi:hypothetical protein